MRTKPSKTLIFGIFVIIAAALIGGFFLFKDRLFKKTTSENNNNTSKIIEEISISYPEGWQEETRSETEKNAGIMLKLKEKDLKDTFMLKTSIGELDSSFKLNDLPDTIVESLKKEIYSFKLVSKNVTKVENLDIVEIKYTQTSSSDQKTYENYMEIIPTQHQTFYLIFRNEEDHHDQMEEDAKNISDTITSYLNSNL